jgi:hypothetical protein
MGHAIPVRTDYTAGEVRRFAQRALTAVAPAQRLVTNRIANATYVLDLGLQRPAVLANSNFVILQPAYSST